MVWQEDMIKLELLQSPGALYIDAVLIWTLGDIQTSLDGSGG